MRRFCICLFVFTTIALFCYAGSVALPKDYWKAMQDVSRFHELQSETNIPPVIMSGCACRFPHRRLLWAVTDGKYYVLHHEYVVEIGNMLTKYSIYVDMTNHDGVYCGYAHSFKDYQTFVRSCDGMLGNAD